VPPTLLPANYPYDIAEDEGAVDHRSAILQYSDVVGDSSGDILFILPLRGDHSRQ